MPEELLIPPELAQSANSGDYRIQDFVCQLERLESAELCALLLAQLVVLEVRFLSNLLNRAEREARWVLAQKVLWV